MFGRLLAGISVLGMLSVPAVADQREAFHIAGDRDEAPYGYINRDGRFAGHYVQLMQEAFAHLWVPLRHEPYEWEEAQRLVKEGKADAIITTMTPEREEYLIASEVALAEPEWVAFVREDHPERDALLAKERLEDFAGYRVLDYAGNGWGKANLEGLDVQREGTLSENLRRLAAGEGDVLINMSEVTEHTIRELKRAYPDEADALGRLVASSNVLDVTSMHLLVRKDSPHAHLVPRIDKVLRELGI